MAFRNSYWWWGSLCLMLSLLCRMPGLLHFLLIKSGFIWVFFKQMHVQTAKLLLFCYFFFLGQYSQRLGPPGQSDLRTWIWSLSDLVIPEHPVVCHSQGRVWDLLPDWLWNTHLWLLLSPVLNLPCAGGAHLTPQLTPKTTPSRLWGGCDNFLMLAEKAPWLHCCCWWFWKWINRRGPESDHPSQDPEL